MNRPWKMPRTSRPEEGTGIRIVGDTVFVAEGWSMAKRPDEKRKIVHTKFSTFKLRTATPAELFAEMVTE